MIFFLLWLVLILKGCLYFWIVVWYRVSIVDVLLLFEYILNIIWWLKLLIVWWRIIFYWINLWFLFMCYMWFGYGIEYIFCWIGGFFFDVVLIGFIWCIVECSWLCCMWIFWVFKWFWIIIFLVCGWWCFIVFIIFCNWLFGIFENNLWLILKLCIVLYIIGWDIWKKLVILEMDNLRWSRFLSSFFEIFFFGFFFCLVLL